MLWSGLWEALRPILAWLFGTAAVKGILLTILAVLVSLFFGLLWSFLPDYVQPSHITSSLSMMPPGVWWVLDIFGFSWGAPLVLSATVVKFIIRRIPVIG